MKATLNLYRQSRQHSVDHKTHQKPFKTPGFVTATQGFLSRLISPLVSDSEPRVWEQRDRSGLVLWHVYDPMTGLSANFESEDAARIWLEQRYYQ